MKLLELKTTKAVDNLLAEGERLAANN